MKSTSRPLFDYLCRKFGDGCTGITTQRAMSSSTIPLLTRVTLYAEKAANISTTIMLVTVLLLSVILRMIVCILIVILSKNELY